MNPCKLGLNTNLGYNIDNLGERFVHFKIMKNRLSKDNAAIGLYATPEAGNFIELPSPKIINYDDYK